MRKGSRSPGPLSPISPLKTVESLDRSRRAEAVLQRAVLDARHMIVEYPRRRWARQENFAEYPHVAPRLARVGWRRTKGEAGRGDLQPGRSWFTPQELTMQLRYLK